MHVNLRNICKTEKYGEKTHTNDEKYDVRTSFGGLKSAHSPILGFLLEVITCRKILLYFYSKSKSKSYKVLRRAAFAAEDDPDATDGEESGEDVPVA